MAAHARWHAGCARFSQPSVVATRCHATNSRRRLRAQADVATTTTTTSTAAAAAAAAAAESAQTDRGVPRGKSNTLALQLEVVRSITEVPAQQWDAVATTALPAPSSHDLTQDPSRTTAASDQPSAEPREYEVNPFVLHAFLHALETSGSVGRQRGWVPCHLVVREAPASEQGIKGEDSHAHGTGDSGDGATDNGQDSGMEDQAGSGAEAGAILGCCPLYMKGHSQGEYVFDHSWADFSHQLGRPYYPKLQCAVPFTPCPGPRLMVRGDLDPAARRAVMRALGQGLIQVAQSSGMSSVHVTFCTAQEWGVLAELGYIQRMGVQFHWDNKQPYQDFEAFLSALKQNKRAAIRKERKSVAKQGLTLKALTGSEIKPHHWDTFYEFYLNTIDRYDSYAYLTKEFFHTIGKVMPQHVMLVVAEEKVRSGQEGTQAGSRSSGDSFDSATGSSDDLEVVSGSGNGSTNEKPGTASTNHTSSTNSNIDSRTDASAECAINIASTTTATGDSKEQPQSEMVAAAFNMLGSHALFGRNWGCVADREFRHLHFEASYYQAIEQACKRGLQRVEAGAQGMHKLQRGYMPSLTYSAHYLLDPTLRHVVGRAMQSERGAILQQLQALSLEGSPYKDEATLELLTKRVQAHFASTSSMSSADEGDEEENDDSKGGAGDGKSESQS